MQLSVVNRIWAYKFNYNILIAYRIVSGFFPDAHPHFWVFFG